MAERLIVAVPRPSKAITLRPLKAIGNLQERYSEATADVVFVGRERLPAHRAVLSVASAVFFKMFEGNWRESRERSIPAPTEYNWEAFKAAITLLYGVEVQVDESSILDVYRVAHCYDLGYVKVVLAHAISQWGADMLDTVLELCALVGQLETEEAQKEHEMIEAGAAYMAKQLALIKAKPTGLNALSQQTMLKLVQSEDISVPEVDVFLLLNQWIEGQLDLTLRQTQQLYSHIRYGNIPFEFLSLGVIQENLTMTLQNHQQLSIDRLKSKPKQITPRLCQKEVLRVYPLVAGLALMRTIGKWDFVDVPSGADQFITGVIFSGRQELTFQLSLKMTAVDDCAFSATLHSICEEDRHSRFICPAEMDFPRNVGMLVLDLVITLKSTGANILSTNRDVYEGTNLPCKGPFPWILRIGVSHNHQVSMVFHCE